MTTAAFDIFRLEARGGVQWLDCAETMNEAIQKAKQRMASDNFCYVISNWQTGERTVVSPENFPSNQAFRPQPRLSRSGRKGACNKT